MVVMQSIIPGKTSTEVTDANLVKPLIRTVQYLSSLVHGRAERKVVGAALLLLHGSDQIIPRAGV